MKRRDELVVVSFVRFVKIASIAFWLDDHSLLRHRSLD
jgi:hypothetical protein